VKEIKMAGDPTQRQALGSQFYIK